MKLSIFFVILFSIFLFPPQTSALPGDNCPREQVFLGRWMFNRLFTMADGCLIQVTPLEKRGLVYREYVFSESGQMLIANSVDGPVETSLSYRVYLLLPSGIVPMMKLEGDRMVITMANGSRAAFRGDYPFIDEISSDLRIQEEPAIDMAPGGHFEIVRSNGVVLDTGWALGNRAYKDPKGVSVFKRPGQPDCKVANDSIFAYFDPLTREPYPQPIFMYGAPEALTAFLNRRCVW